MRKEIAKVAFGVALSIGGGLVIVHYASKQPAYTYIPPNLDLVVGRQEEMPATCKLGQMYMTTGKPLKTFACVAMWTEIPVNVK